MPHSAIEVWSKIPLETKIIPCLALYTAEYKKYVLIGYQKRLLYSFYWGAQTKCIYLIFDAFTMKIVES